MRPPLRCSLSGSGGHGGLVLVDKIRRLCEDYPIYCIGPLVFDPEIVDQRSCPVILTDVDVCRNQNQGPSCWKLGQRWQAKRLHARSVAADWRLRHNAAAAKAGGPYKSTGCP
jgi:hypothetical protein